MPETVPCPACGRSITVAPDTSVCPHCAAPPRSVDTSGSIRPARPAFITLLALFLAAWGVIGLFASVLLLHQPMEEYRINGELVSREEFLAVARLPLTLARPLFIAAMAAAWALWREKAWGRHAVAALMGLTVIFVAALARSTPTVRPFMPALVVMTLVYAAPLFWYFYRKNNVAAYYLWLRRRG